MRKGVIYKITSPSNKVYIGQTVNKTKRFSKYKMLECKKQIKLYNSFLKYGFNNHKIEVIEDCNIDLLNERERYWQDFYNVTELGLNCKLTETNDKSGFVSQETKNKISKYVTENPIRYWKGKSLLFCAKYKMRLAKLGKKQTKENIQKSRDNRTIKFYVLDTELGIFYNSIKDVSNIYNINYNTLMKKLNGHKRNNTKFIKL